MSPAGSSPGRPPTHSLELTTRATPSRAARCRRVRCYYPRRADASRQQSLRLAEGLKSGRKEDGQNPYRSRLGPPFSEAFPIPWQPASIPHPAGIMDARQGEIGRDIDRYRPRSTRQASPPDRPAREPVSAWASGGAVRTDGRRTGGGCPPENRRPGCRPGSGPWLRVQGAGCDSTSSSSAPPGMSREGLMTVSRRGGPNERPNRGEGKGHRGDPSE